MNPNVFGLLPTRIVAFTFLVGLSAAGPGARATTYTWTGNDTALGNKDWSENLNWANQQAAVSASSTDVIFGALGSSQATTASDQDSANPFILNSLTFNSSAPAYTLSGNPLTSGSGGFTQNSASLQTINNNVNLSGSQTWTVGSGGLTVTGNVAATNTFLEKNGAGVLTLSSTGTALGSLEVNAGLVVLAGGIQASGATSLVDGSLRITTTSTLADMIDLQDSFSGPGAGTLSAASGTTLTLTGTLSGFGNETFGETGQSGMIVVDSDGFSDIANNGANMVTINGGTLQAANGTLPALLGSTTLGTTIASGATLDLNGFSATIPSLSGAGTLGTGSTAGTTLTVNSGNFSGAITGSGGLTKASAGTLVLSGTNTYTGATLLSGGILQAGSAAALGNGGTITFGGGTLQYGSGNTTDYSARFTSTANQVFNIDTNGQNVTFASNFTSSGGSLTKLGAGTLTLSGSNNYTGGTTIMTGTLAAASDASLGAASGGVTILGTSALTFTGASVSTGRTFNVSAGTITPASGGTLTFADATIYGGTLGAGKEVFTGGTSLNSVAGTTGSAWSQTGGTVTFNGVTLNNTAAFTQTAEAFTNSTGSLTTGAQSTMTVNGTLDVAGASLGGAVTINSAGVISEGDRTTPLYLSGSQGTTINNGGTLTAVIGSTIELGGLLVNNGRQTGVLDVNQSGVVEGTGKYGTVNVASGGAFGVNLPAAGAVTDTITGLPVIRLAVPGGLAASAFVGPRLAAAGASATVGTANVASLTLGSGSVFAFSVQNAEGAAGSGYDTVQASGALTLSAGTTAGSQIEVSVSSLGSGGTSGPAANFNAAQSYSFVLVQANEGIAGFAAGEFVVNDSGFQNATNGGSFSVVEQGDELVLDFNAVPEPGTWVLLGLGAGGVLLGARHRQGKVVGAVRGKKRL